MNRKLATVAVGAAAMIALAACGSSSKATVSPGAQPSAASTSTPTTTKAPADAVVKTAMTGELGTVLVDTNGMTLYTLTKDGAPVACTGKCLTVWPPLLVSAAKAKTLAATGVQDLATASVGGHTQVTAKGLPLYRFSGDTAAGQTNGNGIVAFGGVWHAAGATAAAADTPVTTAPPATTPPTTTSSGYGY